MKLSGQHGTITRLGLILAISLIFSMGAIAFGVFGSVLEATNHVSFCTSCHSMKTPLKEYQESLHYNNVSGVRATCADCHVPKPLGPKLLAKVIAAKDVLHEILGTIDTLEKYEAHRWEMAQRVWKKMRATDSRECRNCHEESAMDLKEQDPTARKKHKKARLKGKTCIDCHQGVAHEQPDEPEDSEVG